MSAEDLPGWMGDKTKKKQQNKRSQKHEQSLAERVGGRVQRGSGSSWRAPQDVRSEDQLLEHKFTDRGSFSLKADYLKRLVGNAERSGRGATLVVDFDKEGIRVTCTVERTRPRS